MQQGNLIFNLPLLLVFILVESNKGSIRPINGVGLHFGEYITPLVVGNRFAAA
jgi:hypothetical protein